MLRLSHGALSWELNEKMEMSHEENLAALCRDEKWGEVKEIIEQYKRNSYDFSELASKQVTYKIVLSLNPNKYINCLIAV